MQKIAKEGGNGQHLAWDLGELVATETQNCHETHGTITAQLFFHNQTYLTGLLFSGLSC